MNNFDVDLALRLALDSKKAEESDSMILYAIKSGVVKKSLVLSPCLGVC